MLKLKGGASTELGLEILSRATQKNLAQPFDVRGKLTELGNRSRSLFPLPNSSVCCECLLLAEPKRKSAHKKD